MAFSGQPVPPVSPSPVDTPGSSRSGSAVDTSKAMATTYLTPMPPPGTQGVPYFEGKNVTDFLERYEDLCKDYGLTEKEQFRKLPRYCEKIIGDSVKAMTEFVGSDWKQLCKALRKEYAEDDTDQLLNSRIFLETFKEKPRTMKDDIKLYCRQFRSISHLLKARGQLDEYTQCTWFIKGLPPVLGEKIVRKCSLDPDDPKTMDFAKMNEAVLALCDSAKNLQKFSVTTQDSEDLSKLVDDYQIKKPSTTSRVFVPPVVVPTKDTAVDELTKQMAALVIPIQASVQSLAASVSSLSAYPNRGIAGINQPTAVMPVAVNSAVSGVVSTIDECYFCGESGCRKFRCRHLDAYKAAGKVHLDDRNRIYLGPAGRGGALVGFIRGRPQKEMVDIALREQNAQPGNVKVNHIRLASLRANSDVEDDDTDEEEDWDEEVTVAAATRHDDKPDRRQTRSPLEQKLDPSKRIWKEKAKQEERLPGIKNVRAGGYLTGIPVERKKELEDDVIMIEAEDRAAKTTKNRQSGSQDPRNSISGPATKGKRLQDVIKERANAEDLLEILINQEVRGVTFGQLLGSSPLMFRSFFGRASVVNTRTTEKPAEARTAAVRFEEPLTKKREEVLYAVGCPTQTVRINNVDVDALLDSGAEINVMSEKLAIRAQLPMRKDHRLGMVGATGAKSQFVGVCEEVEINIGGAQTSVPVFVTKGNEYPLILGRPYERRACLTSRNLENGSCEMEVTGDDGKTVTFTASQAEHPSNRGILGIFPEFTGSSLNE